MDEKRLYKGLGAGRRCSIGFDDHDVQRIARDLFIAFEIPLLLGA